MFPRVLVVCLILFLAVVALLSIAIGSNAEKPPTDWFEVGIGNQGTVFNIPEKNLSIKLYNRGPETAKTRMAMTSGHARALSSLSRSKNFPDLRFVSPKNFLIVTSYAGRRLSKKNIPHDIRQQVARIRTAGVAAGVCVNARISDLRLKNSIVSLVDLGRIVRRGTGAGHVSYHRDIMEGFRSLPLTVDGDANHAKQDRSTSARRVWAIVMKKKTIVIDSENVTVHFLERHKERRTKTFLALLALLKRMHGKRYFPRVRAVNTAHFAILTDSIGTPANPKIYMKPINEYLSKLNLRTERLTWRDVGRSERTGKVFIHNFAPFLTL